MKATDVRWGSILVIALVASCGGSGGGDAAQAVDQAPPSGALLDAAKRPLERAQEVDQISRDRKNALDEQLKQAE